MSDARAYRFADAGTPGLLFGLRARQALPLAGGVLLLAIMLQTPFPPLIGAVGPVVGLLVGFGRWRGTPLAETFVPAARLVVTRRTGRRCWVRPPLVGDNTNAALPTALHDLELLEPVHVQFGVVRDRRAAAVTAVLRVRGHGFPHAAAGEQDAMLSRWGAALSPFARERSPVSQVVWLEWAHPVGSDEHHSFLDTVDVHTRRHEPPVADYLALINQQAPVSTAHEVLVTVTVDERKVRARRGAGSRLTAAVDTLADELRLFTTRLELAGLWVEPPLRAVEVSAAVRVRSDPGRVGQVAALSRSLAAAAQRGALEWGPMAVESSWGHVHVDGAYHRSYRVAGWPQLPVGPDWLSGLLSETRCVRTVTVVFEPVPLRRAARAADREVMARESDADLKTQKGFRVNARERKRLADVEARERELSEGHPEFQFVGIVTVTAPDPDQLDDDCADIEQAAAQSLLDLRPLEARHEQGWVSTLPLGRVVSRTATTP